jgi:hypothetical protein
MDVENVKSNLGKLIKSYITDLHNTTNEKFNQILENVEQKYQDVIMEMVGKDLYDYSDIKFHEFDLPEQYIKKINNFKTGDASNQIEYCRKIKKIYYKFYDDITTNNKNEKLIIKKIINNHDSRYGNTEHYILITNYAKLCIICFGGGSNRSPKVEYYKLNFWIPKDYILIIQNMFDMIFTYHYNFNNILLKLLQHFKTNLENGHYVKNNIDIKWMDVYVEKQKLIKDQIKFNEMSKKCKNDISIQYQRLNKAKENLRKQKDAFKLLAKKIKMEKIKLSRERDIFEKQMLNHVDVDDLIDELDD